MIWFKQARNAVILESLKAVLHFCLIAQLILKNFKLINNWKLEFNCLITWPQIINKQTAKTKRTSQTEKTKGFLFYFCST